MRRRVLWSGFIVAILAAGLPALASAQDDPLPEPGGETKPIQLALFNPVQLQPESTSIAGIRLSLFYGANQDVAGFDWVLLGVNVTEGDFVGLAWSWLGLNWVDGEAIGWQGALGNVALDGIKGLQTGVLGLAAGESKGIQLGAVNIAEQMAGLQFGVVNIADDYRGLQLGIVNITRAMRGVQIGLINIISEGPLPFMVIANASFR